MKTLMEQLNLYDAIHFINEKVSTNILKLAHCKNLRTLLTAEDFLDKYPTGAAVCECLM